MVKAGYLEPNEAENFKSKQPFQIRMERAARIFYDYVQNHVPELMSKNYDQFYTAS